MSTIAEILKSLRDADVAISQIENQQARIQHEIVDLDVRDFESSLDMTKQRNELRTQLNQTISELRFMEQWKQGFSAQNPIESEIVSEDLPEVGSTTPMT
jgi:hypothetical protein